VSSAPTPRVLRRALTARVSSTESGAAPEPSMRSEVRSCCAAAEDDAVSALRRVVHRAPPGCEMWQNTQESCMVHRKACCTQSAPNSRRSTG
jgi:hypothetical protein